MVRWLQSTLSFSCLFPWLTHSYHFHSPDQGTTTSSRLVDSRLAVSHISWWAELKCLRLGDRLHMSTNTPARFIHSRREILRTLFLIPRQYLPVHESRAVQSIVDRSPLMAHITRFLSFIHLLPPPLRCHDPNSAFIKLYLLICPITLRHIHLFNFITLFLFIFSSSRPDWLHRSSGFSAGRKTKPPGLSRR